MSKNGNIIIAWHKDTPEKILEFPSCIEAAKKLKMSPSAIYRAINTGEPMYCYFFDKKASIFDL